MTDIQRLGLIDSMGADKPDKQFQLNRNLCQLSQHNRSNITVTGNLHSYENKDNDVTEDSLRRRL